MKPSEEFMKKLFEVSEQTESIRLFLSNAGFKIQVLPNTGDFTALPEIHLWSERFPDGLYVSILLNTPLNQETVHSICQKAQKRANHALVLIDRQPRLDGWMAIAGMRLSDPSPFILIPITGSVINDGFTVKKERRTFAEYIEKFLGKGYNPYDARDPVFDALSFFGREGIMDEIFSELLLGNRVGVFGLQKIGKSSILKTLQKKAEFPVAYVYLEKDISLNEIHESILKAWKDDILIKFQGFKWNQDDINAEASFKSKAKILLERLENYAPVPHLSVFLDEIETIVPQAEDDQEALDIYIRLMDSLRGLQQETSSVSLLVAGVHPRLARVNYFWGAQKNPMHQIIVERFLPPLDENDCEVMIRSLGKQVGLDYDDETIAYIIRKSGAHPYIARQLCGAAYSKRKETGVMPFEVVREVGEEFIYNPARNDYFNDDALWGELAKEDLWGKGVGELNHRILRELAASDEGRSKGELSRGASRVVFEQAFAALLERCIIRQTPAFSRYSITIELLKDWIRVHKPLQKETT